MTEEIPSPFMPQIPSMETDIKKMIDPISEENMQKIKFLLGSDGIFIISLKKINHGIINFDNMNIASEGITPEDLSKVLNQVSRTLSDEKIWKNSK